VRSVLAVETWIAIIGGALTAIACAAIRLCWRRGKRLEEP